MKKYFVVLSACALMASGVALAEDPVKTASSNVEVQLTGEVVETPCTITVGNAGTVDLGQIKKAANKKGTVTPIPFRLSECGSYDKVTFHWNTPSIFVPSLPCPSSLAIVGVFQWNVTLS